MKHRDSEQQFNLFMAIMKEAEKETEMCIATDKDKMFVVDSITGDCYELETEQMK